MVLILLIKSTNGSALQYYNISFYTELAHFPQSLYGSILLSQRCEFWIKISFLGECYVLKTFDSKKFGKKILGQKFGCYLHHTLIPM